MHYHQPDAEALADQLDFVAELFTVTSVLILFAAFIIWS